MIFRFFNQTGLYWGSSNCPWEKAIRSRSKARRQGKTRYGLPVIFIVLLAWLIGGFEVLAPPPPRDQGNVCSVFRSQPEWFDFASESERRWGTPVSIQMAFVKQESSFRSHISPPRTRLFGFLPWRRPSSAYGYAQALDPAWGEYMAEAGSRLAERTQMKHALDFIGWYNEKSHQGVGIAKTNAHDLYLAYHEGRTGFLRGSYKKKPGVMKVAERVSKQATLYASQLEECEVEFRCRRFYQFGPFCN